MYLFSWNLVDGSKVDGEQRYLSTCWSWSCWWIMILNTIIPVEYVFNIIKWQIYFGGQSGRVGLVMVWPTHPPKSEGWPCSGAGACLVTSGVKTAKCFENNSGGNELILFVSVKSQKLRRLTWEEIVWWCSKYYHCLMIIGIPEYWLRLTKMLQTSPWKIIFVVSIRIAYFV